MNASHEWLKTFVPHALSPAQVRDLITSRCATVDEVVPLRADLAPFVVARVVEAAPHPDSDRLSVTKVDAGTGELLDVVCGAPNVTAGKRYPFAPVGTVMPGGLKIERRKIRGAVSAGMLCSARELGLGTDADGILELDVDAAPGTPLLRALPLGDTRLVIDVNPNRADLLSHLGIGRELAAATALPLSLPELPAGGAEAPEPARADREMKAGPITVRLEDPEGSPRYMGVTIRGVRVGASPDWLLRRLEAVGARSINNIVDATNYLLHEIGQPMHAFDMAKLGGRAVVVRRARTGEKLRTLDGVERTLTPDMTVIADAGRPQAVAGVMGGAESEVSDATIDVFLEVAAFDPARTRATRKALGLSTDASYRFERGVDRALAPTALARAVRLLTALAGGRVEGSPVDLHPVPLERRSLNLRASRVAALLGERLSGREIVKLLRSIGFVADVRPGTEMLTGGEEITVVVPTWRVDIEREVDLIEEVARLRGYDTFPDEIRPYRPTCVPDDPLWHVTRRVREALVSAGLLETRPMPFVAGAETGHVRVANPLSENEAHLRRSILETLSRRAEFNLAFMQGDVRLFEIGSIFEPRGRNELPREALRAGVLVMGARRPVHFTERRPPAFDEWDAKGLAETIVSAAFPSARVVLEPADSPDSLWHVHLADAEALEVRNDEAKRDVDTSQEGSAARLVGEVRRVRLDAPAWAAPAFGIEIELAEIANRDVAPRRQTAYDRAPAAGNGGSPGHRAAAVYRRLPSTPASEFDLALVVPESLAAQRIEAVMRADAGELLESLQLIDEYRGPQVPPGHRSLSWRLIFRHPERTLRDKEVEGRREKLLKTLEKELGVRQRTT